MDDISTNSPKMLPLHFEDAFTDARDTVLNGRHQLEGQLDNDQTNAVLSVMDEMYEAAYRKQGSQQQWIESFKMVQDRLNKALTSAPQSIPFFIADALIIVDNIIAKESASE